MSECKACSASCVEMCAEHAMSRHGLSVPGDVPTWECEDCEGTGDKHHDDDQVIWTRCRKCQGSGRVPKETR